MLAAYLYDHRPTWHALLIDDDLLFYSVCFPQNLQFASPQGEGRLSSEEMVKRVQRGSGILSPGLRP